MWFAELPKSPAGVGEDQSQQRNPSPRPGTPHIDTPKVSYMWYNQQGNWPLPSNSSRMQSLLSASHCICVSFLPLPTYYTIITIIIWGLWYILHSFSFLQFKKRERLHSVQKFMKWFLCGEIARVFCRYLSLRKQKFLITQKLKSKLFQSVGPTYSYLISQVLLK